MKRNNRAEMWNIKAILIALSFIGILLMLCIPLTSAKSNCILTIDIIDQQTASVEIDMQLPVNDSTTYKSMVDLFTSEYEEGFKDGLEYLFDSEIVEYIVVHEPSTFYLLFDITLNGNYTSDFTIKEIPVRYTNYLPLDYDKVTVLKKSSTITTITNYVFSKEYTIPLNEGVILPSKIVPRQAVTLPIENAEDVSGLNQNSTFSIPDYWVGVKDDLVPETGLEKEFTAKEVAEMYRPYFVKTRCIIPPDIDYPDKVFYRVYKGDDPYTSTTNDAILIMYYGFWCRQSAPPHCNDAEPIYIWVNSIEEDPYKIAYDRWTWIAAHHYYVERNRTGEGATWTHIQNDSYNHDEIENVYTQHASYFPQGRRLYNNYERHGDHFCQVHLEDITNTFDNHHLWLRIGTRWHTYDPLINNNDGTSHTSYTLYPLDDETLVDWYTDYACCTDLDICEFAYDVSDPFYGLFWEVPNVCEPKFPTISGNVKSAVVNNEVLTVEVSMSYDNTGAGGSPDEKHLRGLWEDRFGAKIWTDTGSEDIGYPYELDEQSPGEYILKYDVSGMDINSVLILSVWDNVGDLCLLSKDITFVSAVEKGLHWLRTQQNPDGSWQNSVGITAMAALAFLNADYTEDDPTANKAIQYILANQNADRSFGGGTYDTASEYNLTNRSADRSFGGGTYDTSLAVLALVATHNTDYNDEIADAKDWLLTAQYDEGEGIDSTNPYYGGWSYGLEPDWADLSNTQFALMALEAAYSHLGLEKSKSDGWTVKAIKFISRCQNRPTSNDQAWAHDDTKPSYNDGGFIYCPEWGFAPEFGGTESYGSITAAAIWSFRLCDVGVSDGRVQAGLNWLANSADCSFDDNPGHPYGQEHCFLYYYYMSLAKALVMCFEDDLICDDWYTALSIKLIDLQHDDGYWINTEASHGQENIPEIATDFALLALQTKQPPAADLWMSVFLASNATLIVYDPQGRYARLGDITIPGATFEIDGDGRQIVNLTELEAGKYRIELKGTADGDYSLTIEGYRDEEKTSSETFESTIKEGEYQKSDVLVTSMVGALTIIAEEPENLLVTDLPNVELVSADPTVTNINVTGLSISEINTTYKPAEIAPQSAYMINSTGAGNFTLRFTDILDASAIIVYKINATNQWIEILDTTTTANTVTFTMEVGDPPVVFGFKGLPPIANANGPYTGVIEYLAVPITFDGTGSYDPDGTIEKYEWDLDNDGKFDDAFGATPTVSFTAPYSGNIHLKVTDNNGATDTDTTTLAITKHSPPPNGIHGGLLTPPEQPQCYSGTSKIQGKGNFSIDERIQDWATAIDTSEHIEGTGEFEMASKTVLDQAANPLDFYDPNFYHKKTMQFQGNATNRLINREKFESSRIFGGTGTRVSEYFNVSMIQKDESSSIKTISAPGSGQSHSFATMDDFSGIWGIRSEWQKICQKEIVHRQLFKGNFSVQKDLTFEREVGMP